MRTLGWLVLGATALLLNACGVAPPTTITQEAASTPSGTPRTTVTPTPVPTPTSERIVALDANPTATTPTADGTIIPAGGATAEPAASPAPPMLVLGVDDATMAMLEALNMRRQEQQCPLLKLDSRLDVAAQLHAEDLATRQQVDHIGADGATLEQRLERADYPFLRRSETVAVGIDTPALTIVDIWLNEPEGGPHRGSILNCAYQDVGIGVADAADGRTFWVVDYGQPKP